MALFPKLKIADLDDSRIALAWTLITSLHPDLTLENWTIFCKKNIVSSPLDIGILTAEDSRGYLHGLYSYSLLEDFKRGKVLEIKNFVAVDLYGRSSVAEQLIASMEKRAQHLKCAYYQVILPGTPSAQGETASLIGTCLHKHGHIISGTCLTKAVNIPTC
jgi:hypothetical protein